MRSIRWSAVLIGTLGFWPLISVAAGAAKTPPPEVLSWRHQILTSEEYAARATSWEAWVHDHPNDPFAWVQWGTALRYLGACDRSGHGRGDEEREKYERAFALDSTNVAAVTAYALQTTSDAGPGSDWRADYRRLLRAGERNPDYVPLYYVLWSLSLRAGDDSTARWCLRRMVESGDMPRPLLDFGANLVLGAPANAILLTNGDNDTFPPLAFQLLTGERSDVSIVNLSLLNAPWYVRYWRDRGLPITLSDAEINGLQPASTEHPPSRQVVDRLYADLSQAANARPLCFAVTVVETHKTLPARRMVEGLYERVLFGAPTDTLVETDWTRMRMLIDTAYRMESITDPMVDWERENSLHRLAPFYPGMLEPLGMHLLETGDGSAAETYLFRAVEILAFHDWREYAEGIVEKWAAQDSPSRLLPEARRLVGAQR